MAGDIQRRPTFAWQAILILLPVAILASLGWMSIRQDRALALHEASERAQGIADLLGNILWDELVETADFSGSFAFETDAAGNLVFPPPLPAILTPQPLDRSRLTEEQLNAWLALEACQRTPGEFQSIDITNSCAAFLRTAPPPEFDASARYGLAVLLIQAGHSLEAENLLASLIQEHPDAVGESGLPLQPLARWKLFELASPADRTDRIEALCSNLVHRPSILTPRLLQLLEHTLTENNSQTEVVRTWQRNWRRHETLRRLYADARPHLRWETPLLRTTGDPAWSGPSVDLPGANRTRFAWIQSDAPAATNTVPQTAIATPSRNWLISEAGTNSARRVFVCRSEFELGTRVSELVERMANLPRHFGVVVLLAGRQLMAGAPDVHTWEYGVKQGGRGGGAEFVVVTSDETASEMLASASRWDGDQELLSVHVLLTSPGTLFQNHRARMWMFGGLLVVATVAALVGLFAAWRAFQRQLRLSEMKSNFVSSVSHELRAPIASVRLMAESLDRGKVQEPEKQNEYFRFIVQECRRLSSLIENVLDFSRIEQGRKQYEFEPTDIVALAEATVKLMEPYAAEKGVLLKFGEHPTSNIEHPTSNERQNGTASIELNVDGKAIQQALVNLIDNAIKHSPRGETVTVEIGGQESEIRDQKSKVGGQEPGGAITINSQPSTIHLSVTDRGPGIPRDEQEKIFERFYRRGSELRRETQGVGIGLSIVKHVVDAHAGRVRVHSEAGRGSRFTIELPATQSRGHSKSGEHR